MTSRVVIGGASGFLGAYLQRRYPAQGREVVTVSRSAADVSWDDPDALIRAVDGAALVLGLAGRSVGCRYTAANRAQILDSRLRTTAALSTAILAARRRLAVWMNSSTATIYRDAQDRPMTQADGDIGEGFSVGVATAWESALLADQLSHTRRVARGWHRARTGRAPW